MLPLELNSNRVVRALTSLLLGPNRCLYKSRKNAIGKSLHNISLGLIMGRFYVTSAMHDLIMGGFYVTCKIFLVFILYGKI